MSTSDKNKASKSTKRFSNFWNVTLTLVYLSSYWISALKHFRQSGTLKSAALAIYRNNKTNGNLPTFYICKNMLGSSFRYILCITIFYKISEQVVAEDSGWLLIRKISYLIFEMSTLLIALKFKVAKDIWMVVRDLDLWPWTQFVGHIKLIFLHFKVSFYLIQFKVYYQNRSFLNQNIGFLGLRSVKIRPKMLNTIYKM